MTPTAGTIYRIDAVERDPVRLNSNLGYYTNYMNLLDLCAVAVPAGFQQDGLPFGVTLAGRAFADTALLALAARLQRAAGLPLGATRHPLPAAGGAFGSAAGVVPIAVCGAHLSGLPLNPQLTERGAWLMQQTRTSAAYRLYALAGGPPLQAEEDGQRLARWVSGFICEPCALDGAEEVTRWGGWRDYLASRGG